MNNYKNNNKIKIPDYEKKEKVNNIINISIYAPFIILLIFIVACYFYYKSCSAENDWVRIGCKVILIRNIPGIIIALLILIFVIYALYQFRDDIKWVY